MPFTPEQNQIIQSALSGKVNLPCPSCGNRTWQTSEGFIVLPLLPTSVGMVFGGPSYPCIATVCNVCGNTQLYNVFVLGIADALGVKRGEQQPGIPPPPQPRGQNG